MCMSLSDIPQNSMIHIDTSSCYMQHQNVSSVLEMAMPQLRWKGHGKFSKVCGKLRGKQDSQTVEPEVHS